MAMFSEVVRDLACGAGWSKRRGDGQPLELAILIDAACADTDEPSTPRPKNDSASARGRRPSSPDPWPLRPRGEPESSARRWGRPGLAHLLRDAYLTGAAVSATRSAGRPRRHGAGVAWLSARSDRSRRPRARVTGRWRRARRRRLALGPHAGPRAGHVSFFRDTIARWSPATRYRDEAGIDVGRARAAPQFARTARLLRADWDRAGDRCGRSAALRPQSTGRRARSAVGAANGCARRWLVDGFEMLERPRFGRYAEMQPAIADAGSVVMPPGPLPRGARRGQLMRDTPAVLGGGLGAETGGHAPFTRSCRRSLILTRGADGRGGARLVETHLEGPDPVLRLRPRMPDPRRGRRRLQGALRPRRRAARAVGLRRRRAVRSDREEALFSRASGRARLQRRHARLRPALRYCQNWVTSQALRDPAAVSMPADATPRALAADAVRLVRGLSCRPTTSRSSPPNGASRSSRKRAPPA